MNDVQVAFYGPLRPIAGTRLMNLTLDSRATLGDLLALLLERIPALRAELVDANGQPLPYVHLIVNGRDHPYLRDKLETVLYAGDRVDVFPATAGG
jgi:molybdopterin synthase sulfur carrier subunit